MSLRLRRRGTCPLEREFAELDAKLRAFGYDTDEVGRQLLANIALHREKGKLDDSPESEVIYGLGFIEGLLHGRLGMLDAEEAA